MFDRSERSGGRAKAAPVLMSLVLLLGVSCRSPDVLEETAQRLERAAAWRFSSVVRISGGPQPVEVQVDGDVVRRGEGLPDLYARVRTGEERREILRLGGRLWVRALGGPWEEKKVEPSDLQGVASQTPAALIVGLKSPLITGSGELWRVESTASPSVLGIQGGTGRVKIVLDIGEEFTLRRVTVPALKLKLQGQQSQLTLESTTEFFDFNAPIKLPESPNP